MNGVVYRLYGPSHKYICITLCVVGLLANIIHIWVLTRPSMQNSSVHTVLTAIAMADIGTMASYFTYLTRYEFNKDDNNLYSYWWTLFLQIHVLLSIALHATSLYLVVLVAYIRLSAISKTNSPWLRRQITRLAVATIAILTLIVCLPTFFAHQIYPQTIYRCYVGQEYTEYIEFDGNNTVAIKCDYRSAETRYSIGFSSLVLKNNCALLKINLWLTGIILKAIPCALLLCLTFSLLIKLKENKKKRKMLFGLNLNKRESDRTTYMLFLMVCVFLSTEFPQGFIAVFNAIYTQQFHMYVYLALADILDLLSLINCYVSFTVYFCTCSRYRRTFVTSLRFKGIFYFLYCYYLPNLLQTTFENENTAVLATQNSC
uniref:G_PROTEIN_RECEP_F1_2 domain-containing protein n=1 Tax=Syphacia muris TaxID=451379 RepID=A0A0N5ATC5_9BILA